MFAQKKNAKGGAEGAVKTAVSLLAYKENTEKELYDKLIARGYADSDAAGAVAYCVSKRFLDEKRYFVRFVENAARARLLGRRRILAEAKVKGFSQETLTNCSETAFEGLDFGQLCLAALEKCSARTVDKATASLLRKGYTGADVREALRLYFEKHGESFGEGELSSEDFDEEF